MPQLYHRDRNVVFDDKKVLTAIMKSRNVSSWTGCLKTHF